MARRRKTRLLKQPKVGSLFKAISKQKLVDYCNFSLYSVDMSRSVLRLAYLQLLRKKQ